MGTKWWLVVIIALAGLDDWTQEQTEAIKAFSVKPLILFGHDLELGKRHKLHNQLNWSSTLQGKV